MEFIVGIIILIIFLIFGYFFIVHKLKRLSRTYFGTTNLKETLDLSKLEEETIPKSLGSLDSLYLSQFKKDFPDMNINELKRLNESYIIELFQKIEEKEIETFSIKNEKVVSFIKEKIKSLGTDNIKFKNFKIHNTVVNKYEKENGIATLYLATSFQYEEIRNGVNKKIQNRMKSEYIYIISEKEVTKKTKALGLNCPNCGAPITSLEHKKCDFCKSGIIDFIKKSFVLNDIYEY